MVRAMAQAMFDLGEVPNYIFSSPFTRAIQTADILVKTWNTLAGATASDARQVNVIGDLAPYRPLEGAIVGLINNDGLGRVMLVGHKDNTTPGMNSLGGDVTWDDLVMAEVRRVNMSRKSGAWKLKWSMRPSDIGLRDIAS